MYKVTGIKKGDMHLKINKSLLNYILSRHIIWYLIQSFIGCMIQLLPPAAFYLLTTSTMKGPVHQKSKHATNK